MKKLLTFAALFAVVALTSCKYDDDDIWNSVHGLENRVAKLEELCKQMNTNISSLQTIVTALQNNDYVTGATPLMKDGKEIGYTITFSKSNPITILSVVNRNRCALGKGNGVTDYFSILGNGDDAGNAVLVLERIDKGLQG